MVSSEHDQFINPEQAYRDSVIKLMGLRARGGEIDMVALELQRVQALHALASTSIFPSSDKLEELANTSPLRPPLQK